ncbi:hypothetical protein CR513_07207, partial [Mucuna pruriens]
MDNFFTKAIEEANFIVRNQNDSYSSHSNTSWREHPNFSWGGQHESQAYNIYRPSPMQHQNQGQRQEERRRSLQDTMTLFMTKIDERLKHGPRQSLQIEPTRKEEVKVITLRNGKKLKESQQTEKKVIPPRDETPTKEVIIDVANEGEKVATPDQLDDRTITYPRRIVEDILLKMGKFLFLVDFAILDIEKEDTVPIILS